jgi:PAS domain S-box-containing protein
MSLRRLEDFNASSAFAGKILWGVVAFDLLIVAFAAWTLAWSRNQYFENARMATHNLAQVLENNIQGTVNQIDLALLTVKDEAEQTKMQSRDRQVETHLRKQLSRVSLLDALRTADAEGFINRGTGVDAQQRISIADRDYFQHLKQHPETGLFVSAPLVGRISHKWVVILARRLNRADGRFAGVVYGTITLENLGQAVSEVDVGRKGSISLRGANLELLVRYPKYPGLEKSIGNTSVDGDYLEAVQSGRGVSHFTASSRLDGQLRTYTFRRTANPTFFILVGLGAEEFLQGWRKEALLAGVAVAGLVGLSLGIALMGRSAWRRQARDSAILEAQESKFRLLAENASDVIWTADLKGTLTYISPVVTQQRGYRPEELVGLPMQDRQAMGSGPDSLAFILERTKGLPPGAQPFEGEWLNLVLPKKDGGEIQAEIRIRLVWDEQGSLRGFQGVTRDITERARMEAERDTLIRQLRLALAEVKNLEGMLPICGSCKKIRDDKGYWNQLETFISAHTDATFTHGLCPDCAEAMRQEMRDRRSRDRRGETGGPDHKVMENPAIHADSRQD